MIRGIYVLHYLVIQSNYMLERTMTSWHIENTRQHIKSRYGNEQLAAARHCLSSVTERQRHARYHFREARNLLKLHIDDKLGEHSIYFLTVPA